MDEILLKIAKTVCLTGGIAVALTILWLVFQLCCEAWIAASERFRDVLSGESLIREYKKNRKEFLDWKESKSHEIVRHGRWIKRGYVCGENEYECSECHETEWRTSASRMKWCMFCGAKMDG